jgi:AcrR family transcriptional regulator
VPKDAVLAAAKSRFAAQGFEKTTLREIASDAHVDAAMVLYLFGSKDALFRESIRLIIDPTKLAAAISDGGADDIGVRMVRAYLQIWDQPETQTSMITMLASATSNSAAREAFQDFMREYVLTAVSGALGGGADSQLRATLAATNLVGTALIRYVFAVGPLAEVSTDEVVAMIAPTVQRYLTADVDQLGLPGRYRRAL